MELLIESKRKGSRGVAEPWTLFFQLVWGALFLAALSQVEIPLYPVPLTLQTLGVFVLALAQGGVKSAGSVCLYLVLAALGAPVLSGGASLPNWVLCPSAGYLVGFPIGAYLIGKGVQERFSPSLSRIVGSLCIGGMLILILGTVGLTRFFPLRESFFLGFLSFLPVEGIKFLIAASIGGAFLRWRGKK